MKIHDGNIRPLNRTDVVVSPALPVLPDHCEDARRIVRHGLRRWVEYIGEEVGPAPGEPTHHAFMAGDGTRNGPVTLFVSREMWDELTTMQDSINEAKERLEWLTRSG